MSTYQIGTLIFHKFHRNTVEKIYLFNAAFWQETAWGFSTEYTISSRCSEISEMGFVFFLKNHFEKPASKLRMSF